MKTTDQQLFSILERHWGYHSFLPLQREAIDAVLTRRDSLTVLPTGGGKSLCYQVPALVDGDGVALVVSPLIALMKDQVDSLVQSGVPAAYLNSSLTPDQQSRVRERLRGGSYRLLYVSPERLAGSGGERFRALLAQCGLRYVAIDEAHCISQWGHDFRPEYRQLGQLRFEFPEISLHAFTATATELVRRDICEQLGLREPAVMVGDFDRPNLFYRTLRRQGLDRQLRAVIDRHKDEAGIVYCSSRKEVERIAEKLRVDGVRALPYHAGLDDGVRRRHQDAFVKEEIDVVVATVAFGMGIDRSNVRYVVHAAAPRSLEHYQQEAGRAGRDGLEAECTLFYSPADFMTWRRMLQSNGEFDEGSRVQLRDMERYATQTRCRHKALVEYFGQVFESENCDACDWCKGELEAIEEPVVVAQKILSCVLRLKQSWGIGQVIDVLRGRLTDKVRSRGHDQLSTFGLLEETPIPELRGFIEQLLDGGYLVLSGDRYPIVQVTASARPLLKGETEIALYRHKRPEKKAKKRREQTGADWEGVDRELFEKLRGLRLEIAREREVPPYVIFHDSVLRHLARELPRDRGGLLTISGVGEKKADDFGGRFLTAIVEYLESSSCSA